MATIKYSISDPAVITQMEKLQRKTRELSLSLHLLISRIEEAKIKFSIITIDLEKDYCSFYLCSKNKDNMDFKIDLFDGYYDLFVEEEEIVIQQKINPIEKSLIFIKNHLKSTVEKIYVYNEGDKSILSQFNFYMGSEKIDSIGNYGSFKFFNKNKERKILNFEALIID